LNGSDTAMMSASPVADAAERRLVTARLRRLAWAILALALVIAAASAIAARGAPWTFDIPVGSITAEGGHAYRATVPSWFGGALEAPANRPGELRSNLRVRQDGRHLRPPHVPVEEIREKGRGAYGHWQDGLYFSATDNTDVRTNGRRYDYRTTVRLSEPYRAAANRLMKIALVVACAAAAALVAFSDRFRWPIVLVAVATASAGLSLLTAGVAFVMLLTLSCATGFVGAIWAVAGLLPRRAHGAIQKRLGSLALLTGSLAVGLVAVESGLRLLEVLAIELPSWPAPAPEQTSSDEQPPYQDLTTGKDEAFQSLPAALRERILARRSLLSLPDSWRMRQTAVPGAAYAYYWHDVLHVHDENFFRRSEPLPPPNPAKFRIVVLGDSLTYGYGIEDGWTYTRILERKLNATREVEVINLGIAGYQSEDIARVLETFYDRLQPNLVIYGICHNDLLNSGEGQQDGRGIALPKLLTERAKVASVLENGINAAGRTLGLMPDFFEQVLGNIKSYEPRFSRDLRRMNDFVLKKGGRPVTAMVLDQFPVVGGRGQRITRIAEEAARRAGMDVIGTEDYYRAYHGQTLAVSTWEGHPNEWAHEIFARMFHRHILATTRHAGPAGGAQSSAQ
jgi:lysophospholipase L1-like esterase